MKMDDDIKTKFYSAVKSIVTKAVDEEKIRLGYSNADLTDNIKMQNLWHGVCTNLKKNLIYI